MTLERIGLALTIWVLLSALCCVWLAKPIRYEDEEK
jgi:hypothetical protein